MNEEFYTVPEVAEKLKVTRDAVYKWMKSGELDYIAVGKVRRITASALAAFIRHSTEVEKRKEADEKNEAPGLGIYSREVVPA